MFPLPTAKSLRFPESGVVPVATAIREIETHLKWKKSKINEHVTSRSNEKLYNTHFETRRFDVSRNGSAQIVADGVTGLLADATWILEIPLFESFPHLEIKKGKSINRNWEKRREGKFRSAKTRALLHNCIAQKNFLKNKQLLHVSVVWSTHSSSFRHYRKREKKVT
jgi:hypothetical protein